MTDSSQKPAYRWQVPVDVNRDSDKHQLRILNSFTRRKELFLPKEPKTITWYSCGPTVYDVAHLGHARCYITFDIIRRILTDYFGYHVCYVMNITDIDDKIIKRARGNHLCEQFITKTLEGPPAEYVDLVDDLKSMVRNYQTRRSDENDPAKLEMIKNILDSSNNAVQKVSEALRTNSPADLKTSLELLSDVIADEQDTKLGSTVTDLEIFRKLTIKFEQEFHDDMQKLDVMPPSTLTRVSEFIDEVGLYLKQLESNGFAYRAGGSLYFDTEKFDSDPKHSYAKLVREAFGQKKSLDEGEGELSTKQQQEKKSPNDFALWKKSKPGEPSWTTLDYEAGRPGWHIECSVMASHILGENFDLHSGGCDLKFPHHDNEIAQAEAYYNTGKDWVNYFIHSGHLSIAGCKMSKSLKNFITIRQALERYTARQLRFAFLAHGWAETLDYSDNTMNTAISYEKAFNEFFLNVLDTFRRQFHKAQPAGDKTLRACENFRKWSAEDIELNREFLESINKIDVALCDNFDTRSTLNMLSALVKACNKRPNIDLILLCDIASYIERMLNIFGAGFDDFRRTMSSLQGSDQVSGSNSKSASSDETILKYVDALAQFRAEVRAISKTGDVQLGFKQILTLCDKIRDETLPDLGVRLEDKQVEGVPYAVKLVDPEVLAKERALADKKREEKQRLKQQQLENLRQKQLQKERQKQIQKEKQKQKEG